MSYPINTKIKIKDSNKIEIISEYENIFDTTIYYTVDGNSYGEHQIEYIVDEYYEKIFDNITPETISKFIDIDRYSDDMVKWYNKKKREHELYEQNKKAITINNNRSTSWLRKVVSYLPKLGRGVRN